MSAGTPLLRAGRTVFWWLAGGLAGLVLGTLPRLPVVVASHFDAAGAPNGWSSRHGYVLLVLMIGIALPSAVIGLVQAQTTRGAAGLNIPARAYWMDPSRQGQVVELVRSYIWWLGVLLTGIALALHLAVLDANAMSPPHLRSGAIVPLLVAAVAGIGAWAVGWYRVLRPPGGNRAAA
jgi:hypothetical protein